MHARHRQRRVDGKARCAWGECSTAACSVPLGAISAL
jgi:hypothetical protein